MPRESPLRHRFTTGTLADYFQQGDLIYGLAEGIRAVIEILQAAGFIYVDAASLNIPLVEKVITDEITPEYRATLTSEELEHLALLSKYKNTLLRSGGINPWPQDKESPKLNIAIRRACKLLIREAENQKRAIHVITDGMNFKRICEKHDEKGLPDVSISGGEIRTAYKYRRFKQVYFYFRGKRTLPPWEKTAFASHFKHYDYRRSLKHGFFKVSSEPSVSLHTESRFSSSK
ncbi:MAG: hypothetical protein A3E87_06825 [Gammaproteobacteria bacterium RIFCSPHIGHO2_12_FULL_35_23]|nr:MAG: hypothetical protein A3E87_06825 [Gammaproteobacteria bacterium RIFCSPHIGHO2_12_FULL_35_23]